MKKILSEFCLPIAFGLILLVNQIGINHRISSLTHNVEQLTDIIHTLTEIAESTTRTDKALLDSVKTLQRRAIESDSALYPMTNTDPWIIIGHAPLLLTNWNNSDIITWGTNAFDFDYTNTRHRSL